MKKPECLICAHAAERKVDKAGGDVIRCVKTVERRQQLGDYRGEWLSPGAWCPFFRQKDSE